MAQPISSVLVVGEGSAGLLAALALNKRFPALDIRVLASAGRPIIGVGESTTAAFPSFLHTYLGISPLRFHRAVLPTWKLGLRFERWGDSASNTFEFTFDKQVLTRDSRLREPIGYYYSALGRDLSLASALIRKKKSPMLCEPITGDRNFHPYGYHIENRRFVAFLRDEASQRGIRFHEGTICQVVTAECGDVSFVKLQSGEHLDADLFVDCSGFSSIFQHQMGAKFCSYADVLACDSAVVGEWDRDEPVRPCTTCTTMDSGWLWRIEHIDKINQGYVFSSSYSTDEEAIDEYLRETRADPASIRILRFPSGRSAQSWVKNVVSVGNSCGFVEPLESTGLHMVVSQVTTMVRLLEKCGMHPDLALTAQYNSLIARRWDDIRDFIALHYKFNRASLSEFWKPRRASSPLGSLDAFVRTFQQIGGYLVPILPDPVERGLVAIPPWSMFGFAGYLALSIGMRVPCQAAPRLDKQDGRRCAEIWSRNELIADHAWSIEELFDAIQSGRVDHPAT